MAAFLCVSCQSWQRVWLYCNKEENSVIELMQEAAADHQDNIPHLSLLLFEESASHDTHSQTTQQQQVLMSFS